jgi:hypothetical protein
MSDSITCPRCGLTSFNPNDIEHRFCGQCGYHDDIIDAFQRLLEQPPLEISWELTDGQDLHKEVDPKTVAMVKYTASFWFDIEALDRYFKEKFNSGQMTHAEYRAEMHELHKMKRDGVDWQKFEDWWASKSQASSGDNEGEPISQEEA